MAGKVASILIKILADASGVKKETDEAESAISKIGGGFKSAMVPATAALAGLAAGAQVLRTAAEENVVSNSRLEQVFRSMGDTTGEAARQAEAYADTLSKQIAVEDDTIKAAQAKLATFGEVSSEVARQEGIFDRATAAAADLAAAGFGEMSGNATQLGKALQDPVKGIAALAKSGVTFTDQQKAQIKALMESGKTLEAQKMVLAAIETQVGGTAAATATSSAKQAVAWGEVQEELGGKLLPMFDRFTAVMMSTFAWISDHVDLVLGFAAAIAAIAAIVVTVNGAMAVWTAATTIATAAQWLWNAAMADNPIVLIVIAIAALVAGLIWFFTQTKLGKEIFANVWGFIKTTAQAVADWFTGTLVPWFQRVWDGIKAGLAAVGAFFEATWKAITDAVHFAIVFVQAVIAAWLAPFQIAWRMFWNVFGGVITSAWEAIVAGVQFAILLVQVIIHQVTTAIHAVVTTVWGAISGAIVAAWEFIVGAVTGYLNGLRLAIEIAWNFIKAVSETVWTAISGAVSAAWNAVMGVVTSALDRVRQFIGDAWDKVKAVTTAAWGAIPDGIKDKIGTAVGFVRELPGRALDALGDIGTKLLDAGGKLITGFIDGIKRSFDGVKGTLQDLTAKLTSWKGPADRDAKLLTGAGQLVIDGFIAGLESRYSAARSSLQGFTDSLEASPAVALGSVTVGGTAAAAGWVSSSTGIWAKSDMAQQPVPVYVQNPWTGEYLLAKTTEIAQGVIVGNANEVRWS